VKFSPRERTMIRLWIDSGATYPGTYAALGTGMHTVEFPVEAMERRFDMPGFVPSPYYVRQMRTYGILPDNLSVDADIDVYAVDRAYWKSLQPHPGTFP
jgi:hypothetical protein